jgi:hypothetical protein
LVDSFRGHAFFSLVAVVRLESAQSLSLKARVVVSVRVSVDAEHHNLDVLEIW